MSADDDLTPEQLLEYLKQVDTNEIITDIIIKPEKPKILQSTADEKEEYVFREMPAELGDAYTRDDYDVVPPKVYFDVFFNNNDVGKYNKSISIDPLGVADDKKLDSLINYWELSAIDQ